MDFHLSVASQTEMVTSLRLASQVMVRIALQHNDSSTLSQRLTHSIEGMPRILLSTAHITPLILDSLNAKYTPPSLVAPFPPLPKPFQVTAERIEALQKVDAAAIFEQSAKDCLESSKKPFCNNIPGRPSS